MLLEYVPASEMIRFWKKRGYIKVSGAKCKVVDENILDATKDGDSCSESNLGAFRMEKALH